MQRLGSFPGYGLLLLTIAWGSWGCSRSDAGPALIRLGELVEPPPSQGATLTQGLVLRQEQEAFLQVELDATRVAELRFRVRGSATMVRLAWRLATEGKLKPYRSLSFPLLGREQEEVYQLNLKRESYWTGQVNLLSLTAQGGDLEVLELDAQATASPYRDMALRGLSMPSLPGVLELELTLSGDLPARASFEAHVGLVPKYDQPGVKARFRAYVESGGETDVWLDHTVEGQAGSKPGAWTPIRTQVSLAPDARLVLAVEAFRDGRPLPEGSAVWGNPLLVSAAGPRRKNLVLVVIDTLRADVLGSYGDPLGLTPHLDAFASRSYRLARLYAPAPWTLPSVTSLMTGLQPQTHGAGRRVEGFAPTGLPESCLTLAEVLSKNGYFTSALYHNLYLNPAFGLQQGFDRYAAHEEEDSFLVDRALEQLTEFQDRPFFLYLHLFAPHNPYEPPPRECREVLGKLVPEAGPGASCVADRRPGSPLPDVGQRPRIEALYRAEVAYTDTQVGRLLQGLDALGLDANTVVAMVSDHGEDFWHRLAQEEEYGYRLDGDHGHTHYRELLHLVGMLHVPGARAGVFKDPVEMADLFPTLLRLLDLEVPPSQGRDLTAALRGEESLRPPRLLFDSLLYGKPRWALRLGRWKLVVPHQDPTPVELYDVRSDPAETTNLAGAHPEVVRRLEELGREELGRREAARQEFQEGGGSLSPTYLEWRHITKLRALGYLK